MAAKKPKVPQAVIERAKAAAVASAEHVDFRKKAPKVEAQEQEQKAPATARAKVIAALKKLHPMD